MKTYSSFYVQRELNAVEWRTGWTGPIRSAKQAEREATAWRDSGWSAQVLPNTPEVRSQVKAWEKARKLALL